MGVPSSHTNTFRGGAAISAPAAQAHRYRKGGTESGRWRPRRSGSSMQRTLSRTSVKSEGGGAGGAGEECKGEAGQVRRSVRLADTGANPLDRPSERAMLSPAAVRLLGWARRAAPALRWCQVPHGRSRSVLGGPAAPVFFFMKPRTAELGLWVLAGRGVGRAVKAAVCVSVAPGFLQGESARGSCAP